MAYNEPAQTTADAFDSNYNNIIYIMRMKSIQIIDAKLNNFKTRNLVESTISADPGVQSSPQARII